MSNDPIHEKSEQESTSDLVVIMTSLHQTTSRLVEITMG